MTLNKYSFAALATVSFFVVNSAMASEVELLRDTKFKQGFVFALPDVAREYDSSEKITTHTGLINQSYVVPDLAINYQSLVGINRISDSSAVPPWFLGGLNTIVTPYWSEKDHAGSGTPSPTMLKESANCPATNGAGACVWSGVIANDPVNNTIMSVTAGRGNGGVDDPDFSVRLNAKRQYEIWASQGYWGACTDPSLDKTSVSISAGSPGVVTLAAHGFTSNSPSPVHFSTTGAAALPTGLTAGTNYYVKDVLDANTFTVSVRPEVDVSVASPAVVTWVAHNLTVNTPVTFATTGALPTGLAAGTTYYVKAVLDVDTFTLSATVGGTEINTTAAGTGVQLVASPTVAVNTTSACSGTCYIDPVGNTVTDPTRASGLSWTSNNTCAANTKDDGGGAPHRQDLGAGMFLPVTPTSDADYLRPFQLPGQDWPHFLFAQSIVGDASLKNMTNLRFSGKVKLNRLGRVANQTTDCNTYWDDLNDKWVSVPTGCAPRGNSVKDIGIRVRDAVKGGQVFIGVINSVGTEAKLTLDSGTQIGCKSPFLSGDEVLCGVSAPPASANDLVTIATAYAECRLDRTTNEPAFSSVTGEVQLVTEPNTQNKWVCRAGSDGGFSNAYIHFPSYVFYVTDSTASILTPVNSHQATDNASVNPHPNSDVDVQPAWVNFGVDLYSTTLTDNWFQLAIGALSAAFPATYSADPNNYMIVDVSGSYEIGDAADEEMQFKDLSLKATYSSTADAKKAAMQAIVPTVVLDALQ